MSPRLDTVMLTLPQVSERLQIPVATLRLWRGRGEGPPFTRLGKHLRISEEELARWIAAQGGER